MTASSADESPSVDKPSAMKGSRSEFSLLRASASHCKAKLWMVTQADAQYVANLCDASFFMVTRRLFNE